MKSIKGLTLIELLITLTIISVITTIGLPKLNASLKRHSDKTHLKMLQHLVIYARYEAIRNNNIYTVCPSDDQQHCGGQWNRSVIIFSDFNKNEIVDGKDVLYRTHHFPNNTPCILWNRNRQQYIQFKPTGAANGTAGHIRFCDSTDSTFNHRLVVSFNGRISLRKN